MSAQRDEIRVNSSHGDFTAYVSAPASPRPVAVVVLQEIFGVNANIRGVCDYFADAGYAAIAPDLYWRQAPGMQLDPGTEDGRERAVELMKTLDRDQAVADAAAALVSLRERIPGLTKSAAIGYCFGGGVAYLLAVRNVVDAGVAYYGTYLHTVLGEAGNLNGDLLLHVADQDHLCPPEAQKAITEAMAALGDRGSVVIHEGVGHAFARKGGATFDKEAAERADGLTMQLLTKVAETA